MSTQTRESGFTLIELLIVVVILSILAAIVIPQFSSASEQARSSSLSSNLETVRKAVMLYRAQHADAWPDDDFVVQLLGSTEIDGSSGTRFGPYLRGPQFPENPIDERNAVSVIDSMPAAPNGAGGWIYSKDEGEFRANVLGDTPAGLAYFNL